MKLPIKTAFVLTMLFAALPMRAWRWRPALQNVTINSG